MTVKGVKMVHVIGKDLEETRSFYGDVLGLPAHAPMAGELAFGEPQQVSIWPLQMNDESELSGIQPGQVILVLESDDVRADYESLKERGAQFFVPPSNPYGPWEAHLRDPNGIWLTLIECRP